MRGMKSLRDEVCLAADFFGGEAHEFILHQQENHFINRCKNISIIVGKSVALFVRLVYNISNANKETLSLHTNFSQLKQLFMKMGSYNLLLGGYK